MLYVITRFFKVSLDAPLKFVQRLQPVMLLPKIMINTIGLVMAKKEDFIKLEQLQAKGEIAHKVVFK